MKTIAKTGVWLWASLERQGPLVAKLSVYEDDKRGKTPKSFDVLGDVLAAVHLAMGGDPRKPGSLVAADDHAQIAVPGGIVQSIRIWPVSEDAGQIADVWTRAFAEIVERWNRRFGALGRAVVGEGAEGPTIEGEYGPGIVLAAITTEPQLAPGEELPPAPGGGRIVEMEAKLRPGSAFRVG